MKKVLIFSVVLSVSLSVFSPLTAFASYNDDIGDIESDIVYVVCMDNNEVMIDKNFDKVTAPASLTKIMTALVALENCKDLSKVVTVSQNAIDILSGTNSSVVGLIPGEQMSMENLLYCLMVDSANDAATVIAEAVGGTIDKFVEMMNKKADRLGLKNTHYKNPHGLDEEGHYTTAQDLYKLTTEALKNSVFKKICNTAEYDLPRTNMSEERYLSSTNLMLFPSYEAYYLPYISGVKTGTTDAAGRCIITKATNNGYSYLAIVMGGKTAEISGEEVNGAFVDCKKVLEWLYDNIQYKTVVQRDQTLSVSPVKYSWKHDFVRLVPVDEKYELAPKSLDTSSVYVELSSSISGELKAPLSKGEVIGTATVYYGGNPISTVDVTVAEDVHYSFILHIASLIGTAWKSVVGKILFILLFIIIIGLIVLRRLAKKRIIDVEKKKYDRKVKKHLK